MSDDDGLPGIACLAWALGDKFQCPVFQDHAMLELVAFHGDHYLTEDTVRLIYNITPPKSKLRAFAVDSLCWDRIMDGPSLISAAAIMAVEDFNRDLLMQEEGFGKGDNPRKHVGCYLKVLDIDECKLG